MIFMFVYQIIDFVYRRILIPILTTPYFYFLMICSGALFFATTFLFFSYLDPSRLKYFKTKIKTEIFKAVISSMLCTILLVALYDMVLYFVATSKFFASQQAMSYELGLFGGMGNMNAFSGKIIKGQSWFFIQRVITIFFLICMPLMSAHFISSLAYHLQDRKIWWRYFGLMTFMSVICYGIMHGLGFI